VDTGVTDALDMALANRKPSNEVIFHSDRGTQYTSHDFANYCMENNILRSMGKTGICYDNAVPESTFATYKKELIHTQPWRVLKNFERRLSSGSRTISTRSGGILRWDT
jgi:putative transposase